MHRAHISAWRAWRIALVEKMTGRIAIELEHAEALVLWELLSRVDDIFVSARDGKVEICITDMAEMYAVWKAKANLDLRLVEMFAPNYKELLAIAQRELRAKAGDWPTEP